MKNDVAIRKRAQITKASRTMFLWIAVASALVGTAAVVSIFLFQKITYTEKVLGEKQNTVSILDHNLSVIDGLRDEVRALDASSVLMGVKANESDQALQVVLDALPSDANSLALGSSLQNRLLAGIPGNPSLESLQITPVEGVETTVEGDVVDAAAASPTTSTIHFGFTMKGSQDSLRQVLQNLERSIRTIVVSRVSLDTQAGELTMSVNGFAFYQPVKEAKLTEIVVKAE